MTYCLISPATITTHNYKNLVGAYRLHKDNHLVGQFVCLTPLTDAQLRRLPRGLRERLAAE